MNRIAFLFSLILIFGVYSCKKTECKTLDTNIFGVTYSEDGKDVYFGFTGSTSYSDIELEYGTSGYTVGNGTKFTSFALGGLAEGTYDAYVRLQCDGDTWSDWSEKVPFTILDSTQVCFPPTSIYTVDLGCEAKFGWYPNSKGLSADYYRIEYGPTGFALGTGTVEIIAHEIEFTDAVLVEGQAYDFYIQSNCGASDWSAYSEVESFYAAKNYNRCFVPKNVDAYRNGNYISYSFTSDGDCSFEYTLLTPSQNVGDETIYTTSNQTHSGQFTNVNSFSTYNFMVRTVCKDGSKTGWFTKVVLP